MFIEAVRFGKCKDRKMKERVSNCRWVAKWIYA